MKNIPSPKLNDEPIVLSLSGIGFDQIKRGISFRAFFWENLIGTGASEAEINVIADGIRDERVVFVSLNGSDARHGYLNGVLIETPTQHIIFKGSAKSLETMKAEENRTEDTLPEVIEQTQITLTQRLNRLYDTQVDVIFDDLDDDTDPEQDKANELLAEQTAQAIKEHDVTIGMIAQNLSNQWDKLSFNEWVTAVLEGSDSKNEDGERELESSYVNRRIQSLSLFYIDGTEEILYYSNA